MSEDERRRGDALRARFLTLEASFERALRERGFDPEQLERVALPAPLSDLYAELEEARLSLEEALAAGGEVCEMDRLSDKKCVPCHGGVPRLAGDEIKPYAEQVPGWQVVEEHHLRRDYKFTNFRDALAFVNRVGALAEREGHHPDVRVGWGYAEIEIYTHAIGGLSESDFILAAKIDALPPS